MSKCYLGMQLSLIILTLLRTIYIISFHQVKKQTNKQTNIKTPKPSTEKKTGHHHRLCFILQLANLRGSAIWSRCLYKAPQCEKEIFEKQFQSTGFAIHESGFEYIICWLCK